MHVEPQASVDLSLIAKLIEDTTVVMFTTVGDDGGALVSRPMAPLSMDASGVLWFFTDIRSEKLDRLRHVNLAFADQVRSTYVSLSGRGEVDTEPSRIKSMWTPEAQPWFPEGPHSTSLALIRFVPETAEYWDAPSSRMVRLVSMAVSAISGKSASLGDHGTLDDLTTSRPIAPGTALPA